MMTDDRMKPSEKYLIIFPKFVQPWYNLLFWNNTQYIYPQYLYYVWESFKSLKLFSALAKFLRDQNDKPEINKYHVKIVKPISYGKYLLSFIWNRKNRYLLYLFYKWLQFIQSIIYKDIYKGGTNIKHSKSRSRYFAGWWVVIFWRWRLRENNENEINDAEKCLAVSAINYLLFAAAAGRECRLVCILLILSSYHDIIRNNIYLFIF